MAIPKDEVMRLKGRGFLRNRGTDCFSGRVVSPGGVYSAEDLMRIAECAKRYGNGRVTFTSRLAAEIVGIPADNIPEAEAYLAEGGLSFGGTGARVRPITACKGTVCVFGNMDTQALARELHERFYIGMHDVTLPHKFKIGIGGCPNSCMKPSLNDVGIEAHVSFALGSDECRGCGTCAPMAACRSGAILRKDGRITLSPTSCRHCGLCLSKCPFGVFPAKGELTCLLTVGGTWGKNRRDGTPLSIRIPPEKIGDAILSVLLWYRKEGYRGERLGATVDRVGITTLETAVSTGALLERQEEILAAPIREREA